MSFDRFTHDGRQRQYPIQTGNVHGHPIPTAYPQRDIPRYDPHVSHALGAPQVLGHAPSGGSAGETFSVKVTDITHDPRTFKFVFGQKQVGAFLERNTHDESNASVLATQVPRFRDTNWWSTKVPVYLLTLDSQTGDNLFSSQVCEFEYQDSPIARKRARDEHGLENLQLGSPIKRPLSQPVISSEHLHNLSSQSYTSLQDGSFGMGHRHTASQPYSAPITYQTGSMTEYDRNRPTGVQQYSQPQMAYVHKNEQPDAMRYIAEPRDQFSHQIQYAGNVQGTTHRSPVNPSPTYYQPGTEAWRPHAAPGSVYVSPPPSSTLSKSEIPAFPDSANSLLSEETEGLAPPLQRTSTLSSERASTSRIAAPIATPPGWIPSSRAKLEVMGELEDMARNWTAEEFGIRRRLVQVWRKQEGNIIKLNFRPVAPGAVRPPHAVVISCIYWEERQECFFTSVDAIYLLESLVGNRFAVEEKNRIRRNLEGFRPLTVSKGRQDSEEFFKLIMAFPPPKPRNIEKDVKAFPWRILTNALRKIIGKYSANYGSGLVENTGADDSSRNTQHYTPPTSADMPPPSMLRQETVDSSSSERTQLQLGSYAGLDISDSQPPSADSSLSGPDQVPRKLSLSPPNNTANNGLSIRVPPADSDNLPTLDSAVPSSLDFERRLSGGIVPLSGISNLDFSDFMFASQNASPSLNALFPPPSALGFGPDQSSSSSHPREE